MRQPVKNMSTSDIRSLMIRLLLSQFIRLYLFFALLFASFFTMSSTNDISVAPAESAEAKRVRRLQRRCERERARCASETAEQWEE